MKVMVNPPTINALIILAKRLPTTAMVAASDSPVLPARAAAITVKQEKRPWPKNPIVARINHFDRLRNQRETTPPARSINGNKKIVA
jgi:hypothetical protein